MGGGGREREAGNESSRPELVSREGAEAPGLRGRGLEQGIEGQVGIMSRAESHLGTAQRLAEAAGKDAGRSLTECCAL